MRTRVIAVALLFVSLAAASPSHAQQHAWVNVPGAVDTLGLNYWDPGVAVIALSDGRVLAAGGFGIDPTNQFAGARRQAAIFDGIRSWTMTGSMNTARMQPAMVQLQDGRVMAIGGWSYYDYSCNCANAYASVEFYNVSSGTWTLGANPMSTPRIAPVATVLTDGRVLVAGGHDVNFSSLNSAEIYDPASDSWAPAGTLNITYINYSTLYPSLLTPPPGGGAFAALGNDPASTLYQQGGLEIFHPASNSWTNVTPPAPHFGAVVAPLADGRILVAGGQDQNPPYEHLATAQIYDPVSNTWADATPMPRLREFDAAIRMPDGTVLVGGGFSLQPATDPSTGNQYLQEVLDGSTAVYDPAGNTWSDGPASKFADGTVFNWTAGMVVAESTGRLLFSNLTPQYAAPLSAVYRVVTPPTAAGVNETLPGLGGVIGLYSVDGSASSDADGDPLVQFAWTENGAALATVTSPTTSVLLGVGTHNLTLTVTDSTGQRGSSTVTIVVQDSLAALETADQTTISGLQGQVTTLQGQVTPLTTANATLQGQVTSLTTANTTLLGQNTVLQGQVTTLTSELAAANQAIASLTQQLGAANQTIAALNAQIASLQEMLRATFKDPTFTVPGATPQQQVQNLIAAINNLNPGQKQALYKSLGGSKK
jgi:hypothetical protein